jgi:DNA-binding transcriptional ArsR family regulator
MRANSAAQGKGGDGNWRSGRNAKKGVVMAEAIPPDMVDRIAVKFRMLADSSRLTILACLIKGGEKNVSEVAQATGRSPANVSKHLKLLANGGFVSRRKEGLQVFYHLDDPVWEQVCRLVSSSLLRGSSK